MAAGDTDRLFAKEPHLGFERFSPPTEIKLATASIPALKLSYQGSSCWENAFITLVHKTIYHMTSLLFSG